MMKSKSVYIKHASKMGAGESAQLQSFLDGFAERQGEKMGMEMMSVDVDVHMKDGGPDKRRKYSMRADLHTKSGKYRASSSAWDIIEAAEILVTSLKKQAMRNKGKSLSLLHSIGRLLKQ